MEQLPHPGQQVRDRTLPPHVLTPAGPEGAILGAPDDYTPFRRAWIEAHIGRDPARLEHLALMRVRGDSMTPTINAGELVLVDSWEEERVRVLSGRVYLVAMPDGMVTLKRLMLGRDEQGRARLVLLSDNPGYRPFEFEVGGGRSIMRYVLGRIRWVGRELD